MMQASATPTASAIPPRPGAAVPHLGAQVALRFAVMTPLIAAILFLPAWTVRWWQAWVFLAIYIGFALAAFFFFLKT
ncbi:MAG: hypothetical protein WBE56_13275, partial [Terracidiphilus sp.]